MKNFTSKLKQRIIIQIPIAKDDGLGGKIEIWEDSMELAAEVRVLFDNKVTEVFSAMQMIENSFYQIRIRFMPFINNNMRIIYDDKILSIKRVINQNEENIITKIIAQGAL